MTNLILGMVALVSAIGGGALYLGQPPYANRSWAEDQFAQVQQQWGSIRLNQVDGQIIQLENARRIRRLTPIEEDLLRRLYMEREQLLCQLRIKRC